MSDATEQRIQLWSCGGGRQSAGMAALIALGELPKPDHVCMVEIEWEMGRVWPYVNQYIRPTMESLGVPFTAIPRAKYATKDFYGGADEETVLLPVYTNQSGKRSKFEEYCSGEWKRDVVIRWAAEQAGWKEQGVDSWVGISLDEQRRIRAARRKWFQPRYPLVFDRPTHVSGCLFAVDRMGWPLPPRSRCFHCPNQADAEWAELTPEEFEAACVRDDALRLIDPNVFLHKQCIPLREVTLNVADDNGGLFGGCTSGMCY